MSKGELLCLVASLITYNRSISVYSSNTFSLMSSLMLTHSIYCAIAPLHLQAAIALADRKVAAGRSKH
ncbi:MAG: hypothetical protein RMX96_02525 [Nostoc sp. ChiSLP02]|nr:hypothetical protein [Nostoc sp. DedSLP05]MDZ8098665.1 hypothetical protein [Nostoc sp. DedSLP01]MDZ8183723.1 hypothetical protein [Nostoc sp. ChiSLP02]